MLLFNILGGDLHRISVQNGRVACSGAKLLINVAGEVDRVTSGLRSGCFQYHAWVIPLPQKVVRFVGASEF